MDKWAIEVFMGGTFVRHAAGYDSADKAKAAALRAFRSRMHSRAVRIVSSRGETLEATLAHGKRTNWAQVC